jgi:hypothetical protein
MPISRHWSALAKKERVTEYIDHLEHDTFVKLQSIEGFRKATILHHEVKNGVRFLIITEWESLDAIRKFAGEDCETAVVPPLVQDIMLEYDCKVVHYIIDAIIP